MIMNKTNDLFNTRSMIRSGKHTGPTSGLAQGYTQANLVILPRELAFDFLLFCQRNPKPCPLLEVTDTGSYEPVETAPGTDLRTDLPKYRIYKNGKLDREVISIKEYWRKDLVSFLLGCSFTFETSLICAGIPIRHIELQVNVPMYVTNIPCRQGGVFYSNMVVSMRPIKRSQIAKAVQITSRFPAVHGAPVHIGNPGEIGIKDLSKPDFGDSVPVNRDEEPVFWACGVTPQVALMQSKPEFVITHSPGHMFITSMKDKNYMEL